MNDKDRDLVQQVLQAAGQAGEKGFGYLVHWKLLDGITDIAAGVGILGFVVWAFRRTLAWKPEEDAAHIARAALLIILSLTGMFGGSGMLSGITTALAPEGAAIHSVLAK